MRSPRFASFASLLVVGAFAVAVCDSSGSNSAATTGTAAPVSSASPSTDVATSASTAPASSAPDTTAPTTPTTEPAAACVAPTDTTPVSAKDLGNDRDFDVTSFDGTVIRAHWFPVPGLAAGATAPTVLMGPGWGSAGDVNTEAPGLLGALTISSLRDNGFNVLTWDPRGFGKSTGAVEIDSPDYEGRDMHQLIDWVATLPGVQLDASGDPRSGMVGASYGGGIQLVAASTDCRIDAIVPIIAWNSLQTSLYKADTPKTGWGNLLAAAAGGANLDPNITLANQESASTGSFDPDIVQWFAARGPGDRVADIRVPTLVIQGTVDTLFTLDEGVANYDLLKASGEPRRVMLWFCGGHGACLTNPGDTTRLSARAIAWLDRYVKQDTSVDTGAQFEFVDQDGKSYTADDFPEPNGTPITASGSGTLPLIADGGAGPATSGIKPGDLVGTAAASITPGRATNAVNVTVTAPTEAALVVGAPQLTITYSGTVPDGDRPTRVFAQLVDDKTNVVLGNQITPIEVTLDGTSHTATVPLEMVAQHMDPGSTVTLQIVATTVAYAQPRLGGTVDFQKIDVSLPVVTGPMPVTT